MSWHARRLLLSEFDGDATSTIDQQNHPHPYPHVHAHVHACVRTCTCMHIQWVHEGVTSYIAWHACHQWHMHVNGTCTSHRRRVRVDMQEAPGTCRGVTDTCTCTCTCTSHRRRVHCMSTTCRRHFLAPGTCMGVYMLVHAGNQILDCTREYACVCTCTCYMCMYMLRCLS